MILFLCISFLSFFLLIDSDKIADTHDVCSFYPILQRDFFIFILILLHIYLILLYLILLFIAIPFKSISFCQIISFNSNIFIYCLPALFNYIFSHEDYY